MRIGTRHFPVAFAGEFGHIGAACGPLTLLGPRERV